MYNKEIDKNQRLTKILNEIQNGTGWVSISKDDSDTFLKDLYYLEDEGLVVKFKPYHYRLSSEAEDIIERGWTYTQWREQQKSLQQPLNNIHIGHNISGDVAHSDLRMSDLNFSTAPPNSIETKTNNKVGILKSILKWGIDNIWKIISGVIIAILVLLVKKYIGVN